MELGIEGRFRQGFKSAKHLPHDGVGIILSDLDKGKITEAAYL